MATITVEGPLLKIETDQFYAQVKSEGYVKQTFLSAGFEQTGMSTPLQRDSLVLATVNAARRTRLADHNLAQCRQHGFHLRPNPARDSFAGGIRESFDLIQISVIERL